MMNFHLFLISFVSLSFLVLRFGIMHQNIEFEPQLFQIANSFPISLY